MCLSQIRSCSLSSLALTADMLSWFYDLERSSDDQTIRPSSLTAKRSHEDAFGAVGNFNHLASLACWRLSQLVCQHCTSNLVTKNKKKEDKEAACTTQCSKTQQFQCSRIPVAISALVTFYYCLMEMPKLISSKTDPLAFEMLKRRKFAVGEM